MESHINTSLDQQDSFADTIELFNQLDIKQLHSAFKAWLKSKLEAVSRSPGSKKDSLENHEKAEIAFKKWLHSKKLEEIDRLKKQDEESKLESQKNQEAKLLRLKKQELSELKYQEWKKIKRQQDQNLKFQNFLKQQEILLEKESKKSHSKDAVKQWRGNLKSRDHTPRVYPHQKPWVNIVESATPNATSSEKGKNGKNSKKDSQENIYSPPALYNDYELYSQKAPLFLKKYRNHVASGK